jgi:hypothetical protein
MAPEAISKSMETILVWQSAPAIDVRVRVIGAADQSRSGA